MCVRITNDGQPAYATKIVNAETGEEISNVFRLEIDVNKMPMAVLHTRLPLVDWAGEVAVQAHCPACKRVYGELDTPETLAKFFHETYERLALVFHYKTRKESAVPWRDVPERNRDLMIAVAREVLKKWDIPDEQTMKEVQQNGCD